MNDILSGFDYAIGDWVARNQIDTVSRIGEGLAVSYKPNPCMIAGPNISIFDDDSTLVIIGEDDWKCDSNTFEVNKANIKAKKIYI